VHIFWESRPADREITAGTARDPAPLEAVRRILRDIIGGLAAGCPL
jgi:hypothetical protein